MSSAGARGETTYDKSGDSEHQILFTVMAFDTQDNARVAMKGLAARVSAAGYAEPAKPITIETGAQETQAFSGQSRAEDTTNFAIMLIGNVVAEVESVGESRSMLQEQSALQVQRIKLASADKNPDS